MARQRSTMGVKSAQCAGSGAGVSSICRRRTTEESAPVKGGKPVSSS
ncbi:MAG: hypothetical protein QM765_40540 [Myxococcales bacterium]